MLLAAGILLHDQISWRFGLLLVVSLIVALLTAFTFHRRLLGAISMSGLIVLLGIDIGRREHFQFSTTDIGFFAADEPHLAEVEVELLDDPQVVTGATVGERAMPPKQTMMAEVRQIKSLSGWIATSGQFADCD